MFTAPFTAIEPIVIPAPSNAGPAAVEQHQSFPPLIKAVSPFVPISIISAAEQSFISSYEASREQVISLPTNADIVFGKYTVIFSNPQKPHFSAAIYSPRYLDISNGAPDRHFKSSESNR